MILINCFAVCSARLYLFILYISYLSKKISGKVRYSLSDRPVLVHNMECQWTNDLSILKSLYLVYIYYVLTIAFDIVWGGLWTYLRSKCHTECDTQDFDRQVIVLWFRLPPPGQRALSPCFGVLGTTSLLRNSRYIRLLSQSALGFNSGEFSPPITIEC